MESTARGKAGLSGVICLEGGYIGEFGVVRERVVYSGYFVEGEGRKILMGSRERLGFGPTSLTLKQTEDLGIALALLLPFFGSPCRSLHRSCPPPGVAPSAPLTKSYHAIHTKIFDQKKLP